MPPILYFAQRLALFGLGEWPKNYLLIMIIHSFGALCGSSRYFITRQTNHIHLCVWHEMAR